MRKIIALLLVWILTAALFAGCGGNTENRAVSGKDTIAGTYKLVKLSSVGVDYAPSDLGTEMSFTLREDGSGTYRIVDNGRSEDGALTWTQDGDQITIDDSAEVQVFTLDGDTLSIQMETFVMIYEKQN